MKSTITSLASNMDTLDSHIHNNENEIGNLSVFVNVKAYGAKGDGSTNDTTAIQNALNYASTNNINTVIIQNGTFMIDASVGVSVPSNIRLLINNATLKAIPNDLGHYQILVVSNVSNISIIGNNAVILGDRDQHINDITYPAGQNEQGFGLQITQSNYITVDNITCKKCWGDGIVVNYSTHVLINNVISDSNRRQGLSITSGQNITVKNSTFSNTGGTGGTAPMAGIDIESDPTYTTTNANQNVVIENCQFLNNSGAGIQVIYNTYNTRIQNSVFDGNNYGVYGKGEQANWPNGVTVPVKTLISGNKFINSILQDIVMLWCNDVNISDNFIDKTSGNTNYTIEVNTGNNAVIKGNKVINNSIRCYFITELSVLSNVVSNAPTGIMIDNIIKGVVADNLVSSLNGILVDQSSISVKVAHNVIDGVQDVDNNYFIRINGGTYIDAIENTMIGTFTTGVRTVTQLNCDSCRLIGNDDRRVTGTNVNKTEAYNSTNYTRLNYAYTSF